MKTSRLLPFLVLSLLAVVSPCFAATTPMVLSVAVLSAPLPAVAATDEAALRAAFEEHYSGFKVHCEGGGSYSGWYLDCADYRAIVAMGLPVVPYIVEKMRQQPHGPEWQWIAWALTEITGYVGDPKYNPWVKPGVGDPGWLEGGQKLANERFEWAYQQWKAAKQEGRTEDAEKFLMTMRCIGIAALPPMIEKIGGGDAELLPSSLA